MPQFQNRESIVARLCGFTDAHRERVTVISGEAGIGKSSVLAEAVRQITAHDSSALVLQIDFADVLKESEDLKFAFMSAVAREAGEDLPPPLADPVLASSQFATHLSSRHGNQRVYLFFDTTEAVQDQRAFWRWVEEHFLQPLLRVSNVRMAFAGRIAAPLQLYEVRRALYRETLHPIAPMPEEALIREILRTEAPQMAPDHIESAIRLVHRTAFGHPALTERVTRYVAAHIDELADSNDDSVAPSHTTPLELALCKVVIDPFIYTHMLREMETPWADILPWITILNWFSLDILMSYLKQVAPELVTNKPDHFFITGISQLRQRNQIVWKENIGYQMEGVLSDVLRHCLAIRYPEKYQMACQIAATTFDGIAATHRDDPTQAAPYQAEAEFYRQSAVALTHHITGGIA